MAGNKNFGRIELSQLTYLQNGRGSKLTATGGRLWAGKAAATLSETKSLLKDGRQLTRRGDRISSLRVSHAASWRQSQVFAFSAAGPADSELASGSVGTIPRVLKEFEIRFANVPGSEQLAIREALKQLNPPEECVDNFSFEVRAPMPGRYQVGCRGTHSGRRCLPFDIEETEAEGIAHRLKQLISDCWE